MDSPILFSGSQRKNTLESVKAKVALEVLFSGADTILEFRQHLTRNNLSILPPQRQKVVKEKDSIEASNRKFDELFGDDDEDDENEQDVVVWSCNDDDYDGQQQNKNDDNDVAYDFLNLDDDHDDEHDSDATRNEDHQLHQLGFLNKRHAMFCCSEISPDPREVDMWIENYHLRNQQIHLRSTTPALLTKSEATKDRTASSSSQSKTWQQLQRETKSVSSSASSSSIVKNVPIPPQQLLGIISTMEIVEFEHGHEIVYKICQQVLRRQLLPQDALVLIWNIFEEASYNGRLTVASILALDRVLAYIFSHPKFASSTVAEKAVTLLLKIFHDSLERWQFVASSSLSSTISPSISSSSAANQSSSCSKSSSGDDCATSPTASLVLKIFVILFSTILKKDYFVKLLDEKIDVSGFVLRQWRVGAHPLALIELRRLYQESFGTSSTTNGVSTTSTNVKEFRKLVGE